MKLCFPNIYGKMSNQVFSNSTRKYYPCPGIDAWATSSVVIPVAGGETTIPFNNEIITQSPGYVVADAGVLTFNEDGIYSLSAKVAFNAGNVAPTNPLSLRISLILTGGFDASGTRLCDTANNYPYVADTDRVITLSFTGYFGKGSSIRCSALNTHPANAATVSSSNTEMVICKLI